MDLIHGVEVTGCDAGVNEIGAEIFADESELVGPSSGNAVGAFEMDVAKTNDDGVGNGWASKLDIDEEGIAAGFADERNASD